MNQNILFFIFFTVCTSLSIQGADLRSEIDSNGSIYLHSLDDEGLSKAAQLVKNEEVIDLTISGAKSDGSGLLSLFSAVKTSSYLKSLSLQSTSLVNEKVFMGFASIFANTTLTHITLRGIDLWPDDARIIAENFTLNSTLQSFSVDYGLYGKLNEPILINAPNKNPNMRINFISYCDY